MEAPLVSIITPCYNMAHCIWRLFDSVLKQKYRPIEFILVNDGSTDEIEKVISEYRPQFERNGISFIYHFQENRGLAGAINAGLQLMKGDYFIWPDADDYLESNSIEARVNVLEKNKECAVVTGQAYLRDSDHLESYKRVLKESDQSPDRKLQFERMLNGNALFCSGCHMVRTKDFDKVNPDRTIYLARRGQNWQLLLPLYYAFPRAFLNQPVYNYLDFPNSMSSGDSSQEKKMCRYQEHQEILQATLKMIEKVQNVNLHPYFSFIEDKYAKLRMETAIQYNDRKMFQEVYVKKQRMVGLDLLDYIAECRSRYPKIRPVINVCYKVVRREGIESASERLNRKLQNAIDVKNRLSQVQVTILVACYNGEKYLQTCMECLLEQSYQNLQVIVVNDGSTDKTEKILSEYETIFQEKEICYLHIRQENQGAAAAINAALPYVTGKYMMVCDVDDILYRDSVYDKVWFLEEHPDYVMVRNNGYYVTETAKIGKNLFVNQKKDMLIDDIFQDLVSGRANNWPSTYMVRSDELFARLGGRKIYISRYGQNLQFMLPMAYQSKTGFIRKPLMGYVIHSDSDSHFGGKQRAIEKTYGYAMNRIEIIKKMNMDESEKQVCIASIQKASAKSRMERALQWNDKELYKKSLEEMEVSGRKTEFYWRVGTSSLAKVQSRLKRMWNKILREWRNTRWNYKLAKENSKGYEIIYRSHI